ncbi:MAG: polysaccharide biosynthesis C-terminal domain-containing protein [Chloroflexi bacterium]|nr:polysaccharide biosynthesis C-terminal domain-containing protein [Chloroflexota bacterium]
MSDFAPWSSFGRLRSWGERGSIALFDQGVFSGSNFILNILLARWLAPSDYGAFAVAYSVFLFLSGFHNAILLEPMSIIGPANYADRLDQYLGQQIRLNFALTVPLGIVMAGSGWLLQVTGTGDPWLSRSLIGAGIALPFMLFLWVTRRAFYVIQRPMGALRSSVIYAAVLLMALWVVHRMALDSSSTGFALMGASSLLAGLLSLYLGKIGIGKGSAALSRELLGVQWGFGKWIVAATIPMLAAGQAQTFFTASMVGLEAAGVLRALQNLIQPMVQAITAIGTLGLPALAADFGRGNLSGLRRKGIFVTLTLTGMATAYGLVVFLAARPIEELLYGGKYAAYSWLIAPLGLIPIFIALPTGILLILRAIQKPRIYLISGVVTAVVGLISCIVLIPIWGVAGAVASLVSTYGANVFVALYYYRRWFPSRPNRS